MANEFALTGMYFYIHILFYLIVWLTHDQVDISVTVTKDGVVV